MTNFKHLKDICLLNSEICKPLVDDYLGYFIVLHDQLEKKMNQLLARSGHVNK
jgi:hypothetical protein